MVLGPLPIEVTNTEKGKVCLGFPSKSSSSDDVLLSHLADRLVVKVS